MAISPDAGAGGGGFVESSDGTWFCTLFDSGFLTRGVTMARSLVQRGCTTPLVVYCMDNDAFEFLEALTIDNIVPVSLAQFETAELLEVKPSRTRQEYCWTCTPFAITDCMQRFRADRVVYLDADLYFFSDPGVLVDEWRRSGRSVLLTEHRYTPEYDRSHESGRFCVQFQGFDSSEAGLGALSWWRERCHEWCFARVEDGRFGDQKYIDEFPERFESHHVLEHLGGGVAPWNVQQYDVTPGPRVDSTDVVFYHFHMLRILGDGRFVPAGHSYKLSAGALEYIYRPYIQALLETTRNAQAREPRVPSGAFGPGRPAQQLVTWAKSRLRGTYCKLAVGNEDARV